MMEYIYISGTGLLHREEVPGLGYNWSLQNTIEQSQKLLHYHRARIWLDFLEYA